MSTLSITQAYTKLSEKLGKETAETLIAFIAESVQQDVDLSTKEVATKDFVRKELADAKSDRFKWMFIFWVGQLAAIFGLLYFFIKK